MKPCKMTNERIAEELIATIPHLSDAALTNTDADDILREAAERLRNVTVRSDNSAVIAELQRRLKVAEEEKAQLKARLEAVKYACEQAKKLVSQISMPMKRENGLCSTDPMIATGLNMVICAARGESEDENK